MPILSSPRPLPPGLLKEPSVLITSNPETPPPGLVPLDSFLLRPPVLDLEPVDRVPSFPSSPPPAHRRLRSYPDLPLLTPPTVNQFGQPLSPALVTECVRLLPRPLPPVPLASSSSFEEPNPLAAIHHFLSRPILDFTWPPSHPKSPPFLSSETAPHRPSLDNFLFSDIHNPSPPPPYAHPPR